MNVSFPVSELAGVGEKNHDSLKRAGIETVGDLIGYLPRNYDDYSVRNSIDKLQPGQVTIVAECESIETKQVRRGLRVTSAVLSDGSGKLRAVWFNQPYRASQIQGKGRFLFSGLFEFSYNRYQLTNPSVEQYKDQGLEDGQKIIPVYRSIKNLRQQTLRKLIASLRPTITMLPETLPEAILKRQQLMSRAEAYMAMHFPGSQSEIDQARQRLAFEELFEVMLASQLNKQENSRLTGYKIAFNQEAVQQFVKGLPFALTNAQRRAAWQIIQDFESPTPMNRLLQGDVGAGKTVVAGLAARQAADAGYQTAFMAPTEILANQHAETLIKLLKPFDLEVALLTAAVKGKARSQLLERIKSGQVDVVVGTHALIQKTVNFHSLGFVVIDEQHRFGVKQRQSLLDKSRHMPHLLAMTATPIPRSLALTVYGELDVSIIDELPKGRKQIETKLFAPTSAEKLYSLADQELEAGHQAYIICSLIDDNPDNDLKSVEAEYRKLKSTIFRHRRVGLLHGKLSALEKEAVMRQFASGQLDILISTTVVEVGVDVPNATVMIIENADRFGLSQLHQLRGRVGRGPDQSYCYLVMSDNSKPSQRLREIEKSNDGFYLAEVDLELRGPGEIYGRAQHGALNFKIARLSDTKLIARVQSEVEHFIKSKQNLLQYKQLAEQVYNYQRLTTLN